jgi:hypothetical protein
MVISKTYLCLISIDNNNFEQQTAEVASFTLTVLNLQIHTSRARFSTMHMIVVDSCSFTIKLWSSSSAVPNNFVEIWQLGRFRVALGKIPLISISVQFGLLCSDTKQKSMTKEG